MCIKLQNQIHQLREEHNRTNTNVVRSLEQKFSKRHNEARANYQLEVEQLFETARSIAVERD